MNSFSECFAPYRKDLVIAVECLFCWYWVADLCAEEGIEFVLGHALFMKAIHGGKSKNDRIDSYKIAALLRGGNLPYAYGSCRSYGKRDKRVFRSSLDGRPMGAAHRLHRPGDESQEIRKTIGMRRLVHIRDLEERKMTALPLPRARRITGRDQPVASPHFEWAGMRARKRF